MKRGMAKAVAFCLAAGLTITGTGLSALAAPGDVAGTMGFAVTTGQVNVRASGDTEGEVVGILSNNDAVEIESVDENGWYKVRSGNVEGYVAGQYIATGSEAQKIAASTGYTTAEVGAKTLNIRADKNTDSDIVATAAESEALEVVEDDGDWLKVVTDDGTYGWVSCDYVYASTDYSKAKSVSEIEAEAAAPSETAPAAETSYQAPAAETSYQAPAAETSYQAPAAETSYQTPAAETSYQAPAADTSYEAPAQDASSASTSNTDALYQAYLEAQEAAMHPTSEEEAQQTADAAVAAYNEYVQAAGGSASASEDTASRQTADTSAAAEDTSSEAVSAGSSDSDALYQTYLEAQEAAMHPTSELDAEQKADAAVAAYNAYLASVGAGDQAVSYDSSSADTSADTAAESAPAETAPAETGSDVDSLYQAYLTAQDAANHPTDAADAEAKANAAIEAYNAYLEAAGAGYTVDASAAEATPETTAETSAPETSAPETEAPQTEAAPTSSVGSEIAAYAQQFVGNPYVYGGASLTGGADCSGFTMAVFSHFGIGLPHNAAAQSGCGTPVSLSDIQPGDLLFYDNGGGIGHVTIYIGNGQVCHASNERTGITISSYGYRTPVCAVRCW